MKDLNKLFSKLKPNKRKRILTVGSSPEADWKIILYSFFFVSLITIALCGYFFMKINTGGIFNSEESLDNENTQVFNINRLRQTLEYYKDKGQEFEKVKITPEVIPDPSL